MSSYEAQLHRLPPGLLEAIRIGRGSDFLEALAHASFEYDLTDLLLPQYSEFAADTCQRWMRRASSRGLSGQTKLISCFARVLPFLPYLRPTITSFLKKCDFFRDVTPLYTVSNQLDYEVVTSLLTAVFRLLSYDLEAFQTHIKPNFLIPFFSSEHRHVRYLATECFCTLMKFADNLTEDIKLTHVGSGPIIANWETRQIDYRLLKLYEEKRWEQLKHAFVAEKPSTLRYCNRIDHKVDIHPHAVSVGKVILPRLAPTAAFRSSFVGFQTSTDNLERVAKTLWRSRPTLLIGLSGSGKTALVREIAQQLGVLPQLITLHLNDQTDAKSLLGIYTSSKSGSGFSWQPGILTKAVQEGRWVLIEDIDRAPAEVLGLLRPLIENNELFLPSQKKKLRPKDGFRIFGTVRGQSIDKPKHGPRGLLSNDRLWSIVEISGYTGDETKFLLHQLFPSLEPFMAGIFSAHARLVNTYMSEPAFKAVQSRRPSIRDLMKWCRRIARRLEVVSIRDAKLIPETFLVDMLKDGIDCYAAYLNDVALSETLAYQIAECLNIAPTAAEHAYKQQDTMVQENKSVIRIGRSKLIRQSSARPRNLGASKFALTRKVRQNIEVIASAVETREPLLLVGETGVGKTSMLQYIASAVGQNLAVVNLSNQSEASDLLGGLKPVTSRSLVVPLIDEFDELFDRTFSAGKNTRFRESTSKALAKQKWARLLANWEEAVRLALKSLPATSKLSDTEEQEAKRRKLDNTKYSSLRERWTTFASNISRVKAQIQKGEHNQVFAFVESRLVQAVRAGSWLLLDEINLASSETLDNILSLLHTGDDDMPYLLLTESGNVERLDAHPNFRIFAAMNPATDTGKKDLPHSIRAHFTECFVHAGDSNVNDLVEVIQVYLGTILDNDKRAANDLAKAYLGLKQLNAQHKLTDGAGDLPHFSLRSLTRCLQYIQKHAPSYGLRRAIYEGLQMSFFTVLDIKSQNIAMPIVEQHLITSAQTKRALQIQKAKPSTDEKTTVSFEHHTISRGLIDSDEQPHYVITASVRRNLANLARAASMTRFPILLQGPTSAGKTSMVEYLAKYSGNQFVRINNHEHTDLQEYLGNYTSGADGKLEYHEGVLVEALRKGHWVVLDELNLAPSDVLEALNRLLDDNRELLIPESQEIIRPHPNFMLFATQNPAGLYGGRKRLSRAFRNRFLEIHVDDIPEKELETILTERSKIAPSFCREMVEIYKRLSLQRQSSRLFEARNSFATLRDLFRWASRPVHTWEELANHGYMLLAERVRDSTEKAVVKATIEETLKIHHVQIDESILYGQEAVPQQLVQDNKVTWTKAMRRLFVLVSTALKNNEPVLLVGETGCGKTQICQSIAEAFGKELSIYNAHSNTETGDLIGSQRPVRHKSKIAENIVQDLQNLGLHYMDTLSDESVDIDALIVQFKSMDTRLFNQSAIETVKHNIAAYQSLFAWSDGSLVRAMKEGSHFLLDEISLADDSVLERLNSLLEPARAILLAEKGTNDSFLVADTGFQFLATMNPGGDYGKRELSAALRNRLTEIWVPPLSADEDVIPILLTKLSTINSAIAPSMVNFARYFQSEILGSNIVSVPLRILLTWAEFVSQNLSLGLQAAIVHGAAISFIDGLGANPAALSSNATYSVEEARNMCLTRLAEIFEFDTFSIYNAVPAFAISVDTVQVGVYGLPRFIGAEAEKDLVFEAGTTLKNAMRTIRALHTNRPLLLEGNPGVGKTALVSSLAKLCGRSLTRINLSDQTDLMDLFGADAPAEGERFGSFQWRDGPLLQAMKRGEWVLLDEMNLASQSVLEGLNACLDHRKEIYVAELDKTIHCHPNFVLFATQNPHHQGGGRKGLPASFVNRFTVVYADPFTKDDLLYICSLKYPQFPEDQVRSTVSTLYDCQLLTTERHEFADGGPWELNLRDLNRWMALSQQNQALKPAAFFNAVIARRFRNSRAIDKAIHVCKKAFDGFPEKSMYNDMSRRIVQIGAAFSPRDPKKQHVTHKHFLPVANIGAAESFLTALDQNWPVILAGSSGSGKTSLVRSVAALRGEKLVEFSMNADVDAADIVGGYEQYDSQRTVLTLQIQVSEILADVAAQMSTSSSSPSSMNSFNLILSAYSQLQNESLKTNRLLELISSVTEQVSLPDLTSRLRGHIASLSRLLESPANDTARFVWNDGILIDALESGSWLVLDNANLCNASVLDRLNSLLEPNGCLILSEQHGIDGAARVVHPAPGFRVVLTMDPKFGELSRAMRNRSLEIYLDTEPMENAEFELPRYPTTAAISRLRPLLFDLTTPSVSKLEPLVDRLTRQDLEIIGRDNIDSHLAVIRGEAILRISEQYMTHCSNRALLSSANMKDHCQVPSTDWPHLLAINRPLLTHLFKREESFIIYQGSRMQLLGTIFLRCFSYLEKVAGGDHESSSLSLLVRTTPTHSRSRRDKNGTLPAFGFLHDLGAFVLSLTKMTYFQFPTKDDYNLITDVIMFFVDAVQLLDQPAVREDHIQAFLQIAKDVQDRLSDRDAQLSRLFHEATRKLGENYELKSGQSLQRMWPAWKARSVSSESQLEAVLAMESLISRFDQLAVNLPRKRGQLAAVRLRLLDTCESISRREDGSIQVRSLTNAVDELGSVEVLNQASQGHFAKLFDIVLLKTGLHENSVTPAVQQIYAMLGTASARVIHLYPDQNRGRPMQVLSSLSYLAAVDDKLDVKHSLPPAEIGLQYLASRLCNAEDQPIGSMNYAHDELSELVGAVATTSKQLSTSNIRVIAEQGLTLIQHILNSHDDLLGDTVRPVPCVRREDGKAIASHLQVARGVALSKGLKALDDNLANLLIACQLFDNTARSPVSSYRECGKGLLTLAVTLLKLFVPDKVFDPAIYPLVVHERHSKRSAELKQRIGAWRRFQETTTGEATNLIVEVLQEDLRELGTLSASPLVYRPAASHSNSLHNEFLNVLRSVVDNAELAELVHNGNLQDVKSSIKPLLTRIYLCAERLSGLNRAYDDMVQPVISFLHTAALGVRLMDYGMNQEMSEHGHQHILPSERQVEVEHRVKQRNIGHSIASMDLLITGITLDRGEDISHLRTPQLWTYLKQLKLILSVTNPQGPERNSLLVHIMDTTNILYMFWRQKLGQDQVEAEKQERYYSYKGEYDLREPTEEDVRSVFPNHENEDSPVDHAFQNNDAHASDHGHNSDEDLDGTNINVQASAIELAAFHRSLFRTVDRDNLLRDCIQDRLAVQDATHLGFREDEMLVPEIMPTLFMSLKDKLKDFSSHAIQLNIYTDHDSMETRKLFDITTEAQRSFVKIARAFPDHAVPSEVLGYCIQVMALKMRDPIAKLLTKSEKLLEIVARWQAIASREFSVSNVVDSLTGLIIHWRRLELGSWSRLLDFEDKKQQEDADAWYFIAYQAVIYNSVRVVRDSALDQTKGSLVKYSQNLARTLEEYLRATTLGQFATRIDLLGAFAKSLYACAHKLFDEDLHNRRRKAYSKQSTKYRHARDKTALDTGSSVDDDSWSEVDFVLNKSQQGHELVKIHDTVINVVQHFTRYLPFVSKTLNERRSVLEKSITEQIKLASWKDTNITALRESARRSHFKLFKIVKKYRTLLSQPLTNLTASYADVNVIAPQTVRAPSKISNETIDYHLQVCADHLVGWEQRPDRLRNPLAAAATMHHVYTSTSCSFEPALEVKFWLSDVSSSAQQLRKATPSMLTEENTTSIRDLKQQKRRLLADSLRTIAHMGIRRNLGTAVLMAQSSLAAVLARVPHVNWIATSAADDMTDESFHELIDALPFARRAALEHSEDLSDGETRRGLGFLEGIFNLCIRQRSCIGSAKAQLGRFSLASQAIDGLRQASGNFEHQTPFGISEAARTCYLLEWLPSLLEVHSEVLEFQCRHAQLNADGIATYMRKYSSTFRDDYARYKALSPLPAGVCSKEGSDMLHGLNKLLVRLNDDLALWGAQEPQIEHVCASIKQWTSRSNAVVDTNGVVVYNFEKIDNDAQQLMNKLFVALQRIMDILKSLPSSTEDSGWLVKSTQIYSKAIDSIRLDSLSACLETVFGNFQHMSGSELKTTLSIAIISTPIVLQFQAIFADLLARSEYLHAQTCRAAVFMAKTFTTLATEGFCTPPEVSDGQEQSGKVEQGTGLGEGDAAQDVSRDVEDDEDLTDLAQEGGEKEDGKDDLEKNKDAVDMGGEDLEGKIGSGDEQASDDEDDSGNKSGEEQELEEETGSVDDLDQNAVNEKMWDDMQKEVEKEEKEMKSQKAQGQKNNDQTARAEGHQNEQDGDEDMEANEDVKEDEKDADGEQKSEGENVDEHLDQGRTLDLPEDVQLNGEDEKESDISDADMDGLSDVDDAGQADDTQAADLPDEDKQNRDPEPDQQDIDVESEENDKDAKAQDHEVNEDQSLDKEEADDQKRGTREDEIAHDMQDQEDGDAGAADTNQTDVNAEMDENAPEGQNDTETAAQESRPQQGTRSNVLEQKGAQQGDLEQGVGRNEAVQDKQDQALQKLADVLQRYHQRREIYTADEDRKQGRSDQDVDMAEADFEHLNGEEDPAETQALGTTSQDLTQPLNREQAIEDTHAQTGDDLLMPEDAKQELGAPEQESLARKMDRLQQKEESKEDQAARNAVAPQTTRERTERYDKHEDMMDVDENDIDYISIDREEQYDLPDTLNLLPRSTPLADAHHLWSVTSNRTQSLSLMLTEQLRLILQPTTATKLRGDFRTGKRLNIRRIIPYIASGYKRDKIWMRRSIPSKRNYQVMLAVDDSKSMAESGTDILALETLCMLSRSLSMLEVGDLSIVAFGKDYNDEDNGMPPKAVKVAHPFSTPFSPSTSGPETFSNLTFSQTGTNVRALLNESISLFKDARIKSSAREAADLWQLQIIISDGHIGSTSDDSIRRLVRKAREEKIMSVFVIVDNSEESIVEINEVSFEKTGKADEEVMVTKKYLEAFPFQYYVVVRDVKDLPGVLGRVLKGWFEGVVEQG